ncbi:MAG: hypothetical protein ACRDL5_14995, partial [Solirubrobacteraceae bacterium]
MARVNLPAAAAARAASGLPHHGLRPPPGAHPRRGAHPARRRDQASTPTARIMIAPSVICSYSG